MIHSVCFKFESGEHVRVTHLGLNYRGRVDECIDIISNVRWNYGPPNSVEIIK